MRKEEYQRIFDLEENHWWYLGMKEISLTLLAPAVAGQTELEILDAGCGTGGMMTALSPFGRVSGIDFSREATKFCRQRSLKNVTLASVEKIPFENETFDLITSFDVLYHQWVKDDQAALAEFFRIIKPGCHLLLRVPAYDWLRGKHDEVVSTRHRYTRDELVQKVKEAGFEIKRATYANTVLFPFALAKRAWEKFSTSQQNSDIYEVSEPFNYLLKQILSLEAKTISLIDLPYGLSLFVLAQKPS